VNFEADNVLGIVEAVGQLKSQQTVFSVAWKTSTNQNIFKQTVKQNIRSIRLTPKNSKDDFYW
jgi:hypothetical protein